MWDANGFSPNTIQLLTDEIELEKRLVGEENYYEL